MGSEQSSFPDGFCLKNWASYVELKTMLHSLYHTYLCSKPKVKKFMPYVHYNVTEQYKF